VADVAAGAFSGLVARAVNLWGLDNLGPNSYVRGA